MQVRQKSRIFWRQGFWNMQGTLAWNRTDISWRCPSCLTVKPRPPSRRNASKRAQLHGADNASWAVKTHGHYFIRCDSFSPHLCFSSFGKVETVNDFDVLSPVVPFFPVSLYGIIFPSQWMVKGTFKSLWFFCILSLVSSTCCDLTCTPFHPELMHGKES